LKYKIIQSVTTISIVYTVPATVTKFVAICQSKIRTSQGLYHKDKDQIHKDKNKDKDLKLVPKESLRTRTRINITALLRPYLAPFPKFSLSKIALYMAALKPSTVWFPCRTISV